MPVDGPSHEISRLIAICFPSIANRGISVLKVKHERTRRGKTKTFEISTEIRSYSRRDCLCFPPSIQTGNNAKHP